MKNLFLCSMFLFLLFACSADSDSEVAPLLSAPTQLGAPEGVFPLSPANPYDAKGRAYYNALQLYVQNNGFPNSIPEITDQLTFVYGTYAGKATGKSADLGYTEQQILEILSNPSVRLLEIVEDSAISSTGKTELTTFVQTLIDNQQQPYGYIREFIIAYDASILASTALDATEKEIILTVSTISSYALYAEAERKDRDWETSVGTKQVPRFFEYNQNAVISIIALLDQMVFKSI